MENCGIVSECCRIHCPNGSGFCNWKHVVRNLSVENSLPAHIELPGCHRVFSNLKRFALGVYHGFRDRHLNAYLNEFVFRWNRRRSFHSNLNTIMRLGMEHDPVTYRQIVGDTSQWKREHRKQIYKMVDPIRLALAKLAASFLNLDTLDILADIQRATKYGPYRRCKPVRQVAGNPIPPQDNQTGRTIRLSVGEGLLSRPIEYSLKAAA